MNNYSIQNQPTYPPSCDFYSYPQSSLPYLHTDSPPFYISSTSPRSYEVYHNLQQEVLPQITSISPIPTCADHTYQTGYVAQVNHDLDEIPIEDLLRAPEYDFLPSILGYSPLEHEGCPTYGDHTYQQEGYVAPMSQFSTESTAAYDGPLQISPPAFLPQIVYSAEQTILSQTSCSSLFADAPPQSKKIKTTQEQTRVKKVQNKDAAQRYRNKKKEDSNRIEREVEMLTQRNRELTVESESLAREISTLRDIFQEAFRRQVP